MSCVLLTRRLHVAVTLFGLALGAAEGGAQDEPATVPTVVARAMSLEPAMLSAPHYLDGRVPADWPPDLVPAGAKVIGGGWIGDTTGFRMRAAVFALADAANPDTQLQRLVANAGYAQSHARPAPSGGFVQGPSSAQSGAYCKASTMIVVETMEVSPVAVVAVRLIDGEGGRQNCTPSREAPNPGRLPITVPTLIPPPGVLSFGSGSNWSGSGGSVGATLRTTLAADSILYHYTAQLLAGGWKADGKPALGDGVAVQRFLFRDGENNWTAALIVLAVGEKRDVRVQFSKIE